MFRPLMHDLGIKKLALNDCHKITTFDDSCYCLMARCNMDNCILVVKRMRFSKADYKGVFIWQYDKETKLFGMYIFLNDSLYNKPEIRKAVSTHEFTHCAAALMSVSELETESLIDNQMQKMRQCFHALQEDDIQKLMQDIGKSLFPRTPKIQRMLGFPDAHFRTGDEDFQGSYADLFSQLLFSYELFKQYFTDAVVRQIFDMPTNDKMAAQRIIVEMVKKIATEKCLPENFVRIRVELFLQDEKRKILDCP